MKMNENSLFAILLRSQWWVSALVALGVIGALRLVLPDMYAIFAALPFAVIAAYVGWKQLRAPGGKRLARELERLRALPSEEFTRGLEDAFRREGYTVNRVPGGEADLELVRGSRSTLVACKRWKATRTGTEPLRELDAARRTHDGADCIYVATGEITAQARSFAAERNIRLLDAQELAKLFIGQRSRS